MGDIDFGYNITREEIGVGDEDLEILSDEKLKR
jgi:hypothetical protein